MNKRKKKIVVLLALLLLILCLTPGTYSKFMSQFRGQSSARIANWDVRFYKDGQQVIDEEVNLFAHVYSGHMRHKDDSGYIIAPGVEGDFTIGIRNYSDVDITVYFNLDVLGGGDSYPIQYSLNDGSTWVSVERLRLGLNLIFNELPVDGYIEKNIRWRWPYYIDEDHDIKDTEYASVEGAEYILGFTATVTQVIPEKE